MCHTSCPQQVTRKFYCYVLHHPYMLPVSLFSNSEMGIRVAAGADI